MAPPPCPNKPLQQIITFPTKQKNQDYDGKLPVVTNEVKHNLWEYNTTYGDNGHICKICGKCNAN